MDGDDRLEQALEEQPDPERQVRRRAGDRCAGWLEDREGIPSRRCTRRGAAVDLHLTFQGSLGDVIAVGDVRLLCEECYDRSETADEFARFEHMMAKD
jgi:hypothetical protein